MSASSAVLSQAPIAASISATLDLQPNPADLDSIEAQRQFGQRRIAAVADIVDDVGDSQVDVCRRLALGGDERCKALVEIRRLHIERNGHG